jgi:hypothetical protein
MGATSSTEPGSVDLYWVPLGAGTALPVVRWSGRAYESLAARRAQRRPQPIFHAALEVRLAGTRHTIEMAPAWGRSHGGDGVAGVGPVGVRWLGRSRFFRYEVRRWADGVIPDLAEAVGGPTTVCTGSADAQQVLDAVDDFPTATWGRDELGTGDMWNSNSLVAFVLCRAGVDASGLVPPDDGRAPGWAAGVVAAGR